MAEHLDAILDSIEDGVFITDRHGNALKANVAYEQLTGMAKAELIGRNVEDLRKEGLFNIAPITPEIVATGQPASSIQVTRDNRSMTIDGKPVRDPDGTVSLVVLYARDITLMARMRDRIARQQELIETYQHQMDFFIREGGGVAQYVAEHSSMKRLMDLMHRVAVTDAVALVLGETGVGKELFSRMIHEASPRRDKPFIKVDCASIPENLIEAELFGYAPGAFTGAHPKGRVGFFEMAEGGTIFLDEIGEMPLSLQSRLLRVLQDRDLTPLGSSKAKKTDVRVIAATNRDLEAEVRAGRFRGDLYFRLRVAVLTIRRCATGPRTSCPWPGCSCSGFAPATGATWSSPWRPNGCWPITTGPATCANSKTASRAWSSPAIPTASRPTTCPRPCGSRPAGCPGRIRPPTRPPARRRQCSRTGTSPTRKRWPPSNAPTSRPPWPVSAPWARRPGALAWTAPPSSASSKGVAAPDAARSAG